MKQVSVREAGKNLSKLLRELPVAITNHGAPVAYIVEECPDNSVDPKKCPDNFLAKAIEAKKKQVVPGKVCMHQARPGECHITWCPNSKK